MPQWLFYDSFDTPCLCGILHIVTYSGMCNLRQKAIFDYVGKKVLLQF